MKQFLDSSISRKVINKLNAKIEQFYVFRTPSGKIFVPFLNGVEMFENEKEFRKRYY